MNAVIEAVIGIAILIDPSHAESLPIYGVNYTVLYKDSSGSLAA